ncbi:MAG: hypothetical protein G01um101433_328 [Parcubacteria group bacterium Gr01-1014_33]|nr:MAG: hypothetical protein G01um101433_328 [Parcubacteria group bacterium Gr01-1014_33]
MDCIFLALERFDYYSIVLRSKLLPLLAQKYKVVVLTPDIDAKTSREWDYYRRENVVYEKRAVQYPTLWNRSDRLRRYCVRNYDNLFTTHEHFYLFPHTRLERLYVLLGKLCPPQIINPWFFSWVEKRFARPSPEFSALVKNYRPRLMLVATPGYRNLPFTAEHILFAHALKIPTVSIYSSYDNPYSMAKFLRPTDYIFVWNQKMKREVIELHGYLPERVCVVGCLKFDHYFQDVTEKKIQSREEFLRSKNLNPSRKTIVYATTISRFKQNRPLMEMMVRFKKEGHFEGDPNILVRIHPHDPIEPYLPFCNIPGIHIEQAGVQRLPDASLAGLKVEMREEDLLNQTETFKYANVLINHNSTTTMEAAVFDVPVVSLGFPERFRLVYKIEIAAEILASGAERNVQSEQALIETVNEYLRSPEKANRTQLVHEYIEFRDGLSYQRTARAIEDVLLKERTT